MNEAIIKEIIHKWNPHFENTRRPKRVDALIGTKYLKQIEKMIDEREIIVLTGVRKGGKTTLLRELTEKLIETGTNPINILYLDFDDLLIGRYISLGAELIEKLYSFYLEKYNPKGKIYVFLDEPQGVRDFHHWLISHFGFDKLTKFITASSHVSPVEGEGVDLLGDRSVRLDIYPFDFLEYLSAAGVEVKGDDPTSIWEENLSQQRVILHHLGEFLTEGGYPEIVLAKDKESKEILANSYYRDIVSRDIVLMNNIRAAKEIEILGLRIFSDFAKTHTYRSLGEPQYLSVATVKSYLSYFTFAYLFFESNFFAYETKERQNRLKPKKFYTVDLGLRNFNSLDLQKDWEQLSLNLVYLEFKKAKKDIYYWKGKGEVDFMVAGDGLSLYNVSYREPYKREVEGLLEGMRMFKQNRGTILTKNHFTKTEFDGKKIEFIPLWVWLIAMGITYGSFN